MLLAPMEDVTDASFRKVCKEYGADVVYTEFVSSDGLIRDARKAIAKMVTSQEEAPIGIQIYGNDPGPWSRLREWPTGPMKSREATERT